MAKKIIPLIIVVLFGLIAGFSLLKPGLPPTHDGEYHVVRFYEFDKVFRDGNFYPRWATDLNYGLGVPLFNYVYPLPNYIASFFHLFGFSFIDAFKLNMFFATIAGGVFFYLWARIFWGNIGGIVSSVFYTFSPYHFLDIYIRGSVGEVWALTFFPAFLWTITKFITEKDKNFGVLSSVFLALTVFSHNILALMFFVFALFYILFLIYQRKEKKYYILNTLYFILIGLGLSSIFWLPALWENKYVTGLQIYDIVENFPDLYQLLIPSWGTGFSGESLGDQMSFQIGTANLLIVLLSFIALFFIKDYHDLSNEIKNERSNIKNNVKNQRKLVLFFLVSFFIVFFLMLKESLSIWKMIPLINYFQFPWRFLSLEILTASFLAGSVCFTSGESWLRKLSLSSRLSSRRTRTSSSVPLRWLNRLVKGGLVIFMIALSVGLSFSYAKPAYYHYRNDDYYINRPNFIYGTNSPGDYFNTIWAKRMNKLTDGKIQKNSDVKILSESIKTTNYKLNILAKKNTKITVNTAYFPGWEININGREILTKPNSEGLISFSIPKGRYSIGVKFEDTLIRTIAKIISGFSIILIFLIILPFKFRHILRLFSVL